MSCNASSPLFCGCCRACAAGSLPTRRLAAVHSAGSYDAAASLGVRAGVRGLVGIHLSPQCDCSQFSSCTQADCTTLPTASCNGTLVPGATGCSGSASFETQCNCTMPYVATNGTCAAGGGGGVPGNTPASSMAWVAGVVIAVLAVAGVLAGIRYRRARATRYAEFRGGAGGGGGSAIDRALSLRRTSNTSTGSGRPTRRLLDGLEDTQADHSSLPVPAGLGAVGTEAGAAAEAWAVAEQGEGSGPDEWDRVAVQSGAPTVFDPHTASAATAVAEGMGGDDASAGDDGLRALRAGAGGGGGISRLSVGSSLRRLVGTSGGSASSLGGKRASGSGGAGTGEAASCLTPDAVAALRAAAAGGDPFTIHSTDPLAQAQVDLHPVLTAAQPRHAALAAVAASDGGGGSAAGGGAVGAARPPVLSAGSAASGGSGSVGAVSGAALSAVLRGMALAGLGAGGSSQPSKDAPSTEPAARGVPPAGASAGPTSPLASDDSGSGNPFSSANYGKMWGATSTATSAAVAAPAPAPVAAVAQVPAVPSSAVPEPFAAIATTVAVGVVAAADAAPSSATAYAEAVDTVAAAGPLPSPAFASAEVSQNQPRPQRTQVQPTSVFPHRQHVLRATPRNQRAPRSQRASRTEPPLQQQLPPPMCRCLPPAAACPDPPSPLATAPCPRTSWP
jgi:hypothetical protein